MMCGMTRNWVMMRGLPGQNRSKGVKEFLLDARIHLLSADRLPQCVHRTTDTFKGQ